LQLVAGASPPQQSRVRPHSEEEQLSHPSHDSENRTRSITAKTAILSHSATS
jgi:hypothetical protein